MSGTHDRPRTSVGEDRLRRLARLAAALSGAVTVEQAVDAVVQAGAEELEADTVTVVLLDETGTDLLLVGSGGLLAETTARWARFPLASPLPIADAVRDRELVIVDGEEDRRRRYPALGERDRFSELIISAPLLAHDDRALGAVGFGLAQRRDLRDIDLAFIEAAAALCAQAVQRARLFEYQQRALARQRFLAEAGRLLAEEVLDPHRVLEQVAGLVTQEVADVCAVCLLDEDDVLRPVAAVHRHAEGQAVVDQLVAREPAIRSPGLLEVVRSGAPVFTPVLPAEQGEERAEDAAHLALIRALQATSGLAVPLRARGHNIGVLLLLQTGTSRPLTSDDADLAALLAARAALAIDNARLLAERAELVDNLRVALSSHKAIEQAKGMLAARWSTTPEAAFDAMRRRARSSRRRIDEVAVDVVEGRDDLPPPG